MNTLRIRRRTWGQSVLSVFVMSWLSVSLQPCLMAMELVPDLAIAAESVHSEHMSHAGGMNDLSDPHANCEHCPPVDYGSAANCDVEMSSACQSDDQCTLHSRRTQIVPKDASVDPPDSIVPPITQPPFVNHKIEPLGDYYLFNEPIVHRSLNLINCVFLK